MTRAIEEITIEQYRALAKQPRGRKASIPRAAPDARVGLSDLLKRWSIQGVDGIGVRLYQGTLTSATKDTGMCATLAEACKRARELEAS